ncbi:phosphotransferase [Flaviflagellibacter deserti]|uniref:Phosphotransferase n=1 Tax=Flaviflagellibacter deserti TaxID=2267266 RepID=A0ABV9Z347_9HYPH
MKQIGDAATDAERAIEGVLAKMPAWAGEPIRYQPVSGGISNANWRVSVDGHEIDYFVKVPGRGTEMFIERNAANNASRRAHESGVGARVVDFLVDDGIEIFQFVEGYRASTNLDFMRPTVRMNALKGLKAFNDSPRLDLTKTIFDLIDEHLHQIAELDGYEPPDFAWLKAQYENARAAVSASGLDLVPCMNDTLAGNFMLGPDDEVMLVDFEYASNNDRAYELANWFGEMFFPRTVERELVEAYYGSCTPQIEARIAVMKALADLKWSSWAMVQERVSAIDFDFHKYGVWKHMRARTVMHHPDWPEWLRSL